MDLFLEFINKRKNEIDSAEFILCTGLFDNHENDLFYYKNLLKKYVNKKMICTNPDLIVDRGEKREYCAGSVAKSFEEIKGKVIYFGKPHPPVYNLSTNLNNKRVLCIGDNLNTDIKGANIQNFNSLFKSSASIATSTVDNIIYSFNLLNQGITTWASHFSTDLH